MWKFHVCFTKSFGKRICAGIVPPYSGSNIHLVRSAEERRECILVAGLAVGRKGVKADDRATQRAEQRTRGGDRAGLFLGPGTHVHHVLAGGLVSGELPQPAFVEIESAAVPDV